MLLPGYSRAQCAAADYHAAAAAADDDDDDDDDHDTHNSGIYSIMRHPSYSAWMVWSVCTQLVLVSCGC